MRIVAAAVIDRVLFYSLLVLIGLVAIPYGSVEPWWKAVFQCLVFILSGFSIIEFRLRNEIHTRASRRPNITLHGNAALFLPIMALLILALSQTLSWPGYSIGGISDLHKALSSDPFETRLFAIQVFALLLFGWMLVRHTRNQRRLCFLIDTIIAVAVISAAFGLWRQARQQQMGFILPYLRPGFGYGQFINSNHFAFLMEMALGLALGIAARRGARGLRLVLYLIAAIPMWIAVVLSNSRGGILSILCQVVLLAGLLVTGANEAPLEAKRRGTRLRQIAGQAMLVLVLVIGSAVTIVLVGGDPLAERANSLSTEFDRKAAETFALRPNVWSATWELIKDHPIAGVGFGGYWIAISKYHHASGETTPQQAHSDYLELLASGGLIALAIGVWFIVSFAGVTRRALRNADPAGRAAILGAMTGMLTVSVHSLVDFGLHIPINALVFTALIAMVCIVHKQSNSQSTTEHGSLTYGWR